MTARARATDPVERFRLNLPGLFPPTILARDLLPLIGKTNAQEVAGLAPHGCLLGEVAVCVDYCPGAPLPQLWVLRLGIDVPRVAGARFASALGADFAPVARALGPAPDGG
jgi:hypothetical protein